MSSVAVLGAGPIGAAVADRIAQRGRVAEIRLIDPDAGVAAGKALDILQSGPIERFDTRLVAMTDPLAAVSASIIVVADAVSHGEWEGERGLALMKTLSAAGTSAPVVFAGARQTSLMEASWRTLGFKADRLVGTAASAFASAVRSIAAMELNLSDVELAVVGRAPSFVIGWSSAVTAGSLLTDRIPGHRLLAISEDSTRLWPPGPRSIGSATAGIVEALLFGTRRRLHGMAIVQNQEGGPGYALLLPLELGRLRVLSHAMPSLSPMEQTAVLKSLSQTS